MYVINKLKPDRNFYFLLIPFATFLVAAFLAFAISIEAMFIFFAVFFWGYALYSLLTTVRTHNLGFLVAVCYQTAVGLMALSFPQSINNREQMKPLMWFLISTVVFFLVWLIILTVNKKLKWRGREVLELAALPVDAIGNGYTARPLPAGKTEFTQRQIMEFAEFARRNLIAVSYVGKDKVVFVPVMAGREFLFILGLKGDYTDETWIAFDFEGNISVNISHRDYLEYKESLAFDKLCESLGNLFVEFMEMYQHGEGVRIIDRMNAVGVSVFS
jgi:hypothetical protein